MWFLVTGHTGHCVTHADTDPSLIAHTCVTQRQFPVRGWALCVIDSRRKMPVP